MLTIFLINELSIENNLDIKQFFDTLCTHKSAFSFTASFLSKMFPFFFQLTKDNSIKLMKKHYGSRIPLTIALKNHQKPSRAD